MSHWRRLSRKHRTLYLALAILALAATALASSRLTPSWKTETASATKSEDPVSLGGTLPTPSDVFIQQTDAFPELGNVLLTVKLTPEQVARKEEEGTASYTTIGNLGEILFRDDGESGDSTAGDALYTAVARVDTEDLAKRAEQDAAILRTASAEVPVFSGRALTGSQTQSAFDLAGFQAGRAVNLNPPVVNVGPTRGPFVWPPPTDPRNDFQRRVLMITDTSVIADPDRTFDPCSQSGTPGGVWTFKHLMTEMALNTGRPVSTFTEEWLKNWTSTQTINSFAVPPRTVASFGTVKNTMADLIADWRIASGGNLDLDLAPFRLVAIVPRLDLRHAGPGGGNFLDAGEVRFIFGLVRTSWMSSVEFHVPRSYNDSCALPFSAIFEYQIPKTTCSGVTGWARQWAALNNPDLTPSAYNTRLAGLTEQFVKAGASPAQPYGSAIGQIRTNEIALGDSWNWPQDPWQLREFRLNWSPWWLNPLGETTTKDTPDDTLNTSTTFQSWILSTIAPALSGPNWNQLVTEVPVSYLASHFQGAHPEIPAAGGFFWTANGLTLSPNGGNNAENWGRHRASLDTCNGCHDRETGASFVHVDTTKPLGDWHALSGFLTGITVNDPAEAGGLPHRTFNDLARRENDLRSLASTLCLQVATVDVAYVRGQLAETGKIPPNPFPDGVTDEQFLSLAVDDLKANHITEVH